MIELTTAAVQAHAMFRPTRSHIASSTSPRLAHLVPFSENLIRFLTRDHEPEITSDEMREILVLKERQDTSQRNRTIFQDRSIPWIEQNLTVNQRFHGLFLIHLSTSKKRRPRRLERCPRGSHVRPSCERSYRPGACAPAWAAP